MPSTQSTVALPVTLPETLLATEPPAQPVSQPSTTRPSVALLTALWFGSFLAALDSTVVSTLMGDIASDLNALGSVSWVATTFLVANSAFQPFYGKLSDIFGRKPVLLVCTSLFALSCQLCASASSIYSLIIARMICGVGAGGVMSMSSITISDLVPSRSRGVYQGIGNVTFASGASLGGFFGGLAQEYKDWRFAFSCQVPLCLLSMVVIALIMPANINKTNSGPTNGGAALSAYKRLDICGSVLLSSAVCLLMFGVSVGGSIYPWKSLPVVGCSLISLVLFVVFAKWEKYAVEPVLPIHILTNRTVLGNCIKLFFASGIVYTCLFYVPIYFAAVYNYTPTQISHRLFATFIGGATGSLGTGLTIRKTGKYYILRVCAALGIVLSSGLWLAMTLSPVGEKRWWQLCAYGLQGMSFYAILTVSLVSTIAAVPQYQSTGTSAQYTFRGAGSSVILACSGAIFNNILSQQLHRRITGKHAAEIIHKVAKSVSAIRQIPQEYQGAVIESYKVAFAVLFGAMLAISFLSLVAASGVEENELEG